MRHEIIARREGHDPQRTPPGGGPQDPNDPLDEPRGAEKPEPGPEEAWSPGRETEPVTQA